MAYGAFVILRDLDFEVRRGDVFIIMGGSGSGKGTLLRTMVGLLEPATGSVFYEHDDFTHADAEERRRLSRRFGVLYQRGRSGAR